ncbi:MAG: ferritin family protein [Chloroflexota bacterium]
MDSQATIDELITMAISAELAARDLYLQLEKMFAPHKDVALFWKHYADEEAGHARWLEQLRQRLSAEQLAAPADSTALENARKALAIPVETLLAQIDNLEDAYQLVNELEGSETNAVFDFLIGEFSEDEKTLAFLRTQLREHVGRLMIDLPARFKGVGLRLQTRAVRPDR